MILRFRWKLFLSHLLILLSALGVFYVWAGSWLRGFYLETVKAQLENQVRSLAPLIAVDELELDPLVDAAGRNASVRVTVISPTGTVLADSAFSGESLRRLENHFNRPEVQQSLTDGVGTSIRFSTSVQDELLYLALRLPEDRGFLRISTPLSGIQSGLVELRSALVSRAIVLAGLGLLLSFLMATGLTRSIATLSAAASRIARGDFETPINVSSSDEVGVLARQMRSMSGHLKGLVGSLQAEREFLQTILGSMREAVMVTDRQGRIRNVNPAFRRIFPSDRDPIGCLPLEVIRKVEIEDGLARVLDALEPVPVEIEVAGKTLLVHFAQPASDITGVAVVAVFHDITELRRLEQIRKDFVSNVSHELRTPLTSIQGYSETLLDEPGLADHSRRFLEKIARNARHLNEVVTALLELSKIEGQRMSLTRETIGVEDVRREMQRVYQSEAEAKGLQLLFENRSGLDKFRASPLFFQQALHNLIDNAIRYTDEGSVSVTLSLQDESVCFEVADSGVGIPLSEQDRVFERFYRVSANTSMWRGGSGIGLSIVRHIVRLHKGEVWLESEVGQGTRVFFTIPQQVGGAYSA